MNIDGLGPETIDALFDKGLVTSPIDLYKLTYNDLIHLDRFAAKSAQNLLTSLTNSIAKSSFSSFLFALGIRHVGITVAQKLASHFKSMKSLITASPTELLEVEEIGEKIAISLGQYLQDERNVRHINMFGALGVRLVSEKTNTTISSNTFEGQSFVVSGVFDTFSREELKKDIISNGGKIVSSISGKLNFLIAGDKMGPSKLEKARKLEVKILSEQEYIQLRKA
jgi:DNA ligase (NAD+)